MSNGIMRAMLGDDIDRDAYVNREALLAGVRHHMTCNISGVLLDIRRAVMVSFAQGDVSKGAAVLDGVTWDRVADDLRANAIKQGLTITEVIDGRDYTARGTLTVRARKRIESERAAAQSAAQPVQ